MEKAIYPKGIYFNEPSPKAPTFIKGNISIDVNKFIEFISENRNLLNDKGYLRLNILEKKVEDQYGKYNIQVDTWKPSKQEEVVNIDDVPDSI